MTYVSLITHNAIIFAQDLSGKKCAEIHIYFKLFELSEYIFIINLLQFKWTVKSFARHYSTIHFHKNIFEEHISVKSNFQYSSLVKLLVMYLYSKTTYDEFMYSLANN